mmetsp:Transcript_120512/g.239874  ORF Transcript_120512/g.239874 Transcript_120512/m.239874 type:complete len:88 (+) Transcript_120512:344-607(+)
MKLTIFCNKGVYLKRYSNMCTTSITMRMAESKTQAALSCLNFKLATEVLQAEVYLPRKKKSRLRLRQSGIAMLRKATSALKDFTHGS